MDPIRQAFEAFVGADTIEKMQQVVMQYPFVTDPMFIEAINEFRQDKVLDQHQAAFEERLGWLHQLADD